MPALDRAVPLGEYIRAVKLARERPDAEFRHGFTTWWPTSGAEIIRQFRRGMHERISEAIPYRRRGFCR